MCIPVRCQTCGKCIGKKKIILAILDLRKQAKKEFGYKKDIECSIKPIFLKFKIKKYCCRSVLISFMNIDELIF